MPNTILGLDQSSSTTGWCILVRSPYQAVYLPHSVGKLQGVGSAKGALALDALVSQAVSLGRPVLAVIESHPAYGRGKVISALGRSTGAVLQALGSRSITGTGILQVTPHEWRRSVLALSSHTPRDEAKRAALAYARDTVARYYYPKLITEDIAESYCIALHVLTTLIKGT